MSRDKPIVFNLNNCDYAIIDLDDWYQGHIRANFKPLLRKMVEHEYDADNEEYHNETIELRLAHAQRQILFIRDDVETRFYSNKYREDAEVILDKIPDGDICFKINGVEALFRMVDILREIGIYQIYEIDVMKTYDFGDFKVVYVKYGTE